MATTIRRKPVPSPPALSDLSHHHSSHPGSGLVLVESPSSISAPEYSSAALPLVHNRVHSEPTSTTVATHDGTKDQGSIPLYQSLGPPTIGGNSPSPADSALGSPQPTQEASGSAATHTRPTSSVLGSAFKHAFGEARYFAGGLITHAHESSKHYSIQRHSHSFVYYAGHYTSIALTVFADRPLPADRSYWLQRKGFSGHSGLAIGTLMGAHGSWVNVTPTVHATVNQIKPADERAYQRDIDRFLRCATKKSRNHVPQETCVLRIPCDTHDGYLRVVLCAGEGGKKTLCPSPVFRLFSTSTDSSAIRGASLKTLPLEMGIKVGSMIANTAARSAVTATAGPLVSSAKQYVGGQITGVLQPTALEQRAATLLYDQAASSVTGKVDALDAEAEAARDSKVDDVIDDEWHEAIIYIGLRHIDDDSKAWDIVQKKAVQVHILQDFEGATFFDARVSLIMMAFLRPVSHQHEKQGLQMRRAALVQDAACAMASLARPEWTADAALSRMKEEKASRSISQRYVDLRQGAQKSIDKVPLHRLGVRTEGHEMSDRLIGNGGVWIKR
ncbi:hypothetical protein DV737_g631, partial [Chaetothyriales sp. CBS 132003]